MKKILSLIGALTLVGTASAPVIACKWQSVSQKEVNEIKAKITDIALTISLASTKTVEANVVAIKTALNADNPTLTTADLAKITFTASGDFVPGTAKAVTATITVGSDTATKALQVTMQTAQQAADAIKAKIYDVNLSIPFASDKTVSSPINTAAIRAALKTENTSLTTDDVTKITFTPKKTGAPFVPGTALDVTATITVGSDTATKALQVTMLTA